MDRRAFLGALAFLGAPLAAGAQQAGKVHRISFLGLTPGEDTTSMKLLVERLHELSYSEGRNMTFEYRSAEGRPERLPQLLTAEAIGPGAAVIIGNRAVDVDAARAAIPSIGVLWGYDSAAELTDAGADALRATPGELPTCVSRVAGER